MSTLADLDRVLADLDPSVRAIVAPIVLVLKALIEGLQQELARKDARIEQLLRTIYGRKSEHVPDPKREARKRANSKRTPEEREAARQNSRENTRRKRAELPVVEKTIPIPEEDRICRACGGTDLHRVGEGEVSEQIEFIPARTVRIRWVREKVACACGECVITAPAPPQVREGGLYGPNFHAQVVVAKTCDAMPLHRQAKALAREGCHINPTQVGAMFHRVADQVEPIYKAIGATVPESSHVSADETTQPVLEKGGTRKGWMWTFIVPAAIYFKYDPTRAGKVPGAVLGTSKGVLHVDGYSGYNTVTVPEQRRRAGCWSHGRRKLFECRKHHGHVVDPILDEIGKLFDVEVAAADRGLYGTDAHLALRQAESRPVVDRIFELLQEARGRAGPRSTLGEALAYSINQEKALRVFLEDPKVALDNNISERALRIVALLRKNALFVGHDEGGQNLAILLTIVATCALHGVEPRRYLADVIVRVNVPGVTVDELLPWNWKAPAG
ncbi:MAG: IS66 family transposase [Pseudomonadota bacterium]|nr:IS66 family transposase [Pseudomonadota bacterium]